MGVDSFLESINYLSFIKILSIIFSENPCYCTCTEQGPKLTGTVSWRSGRKRTWKGLAHSGRQGTKHLLNGGVSSGGMC